MNLNSKVRGTNPAVARYSFPDLDLRLFEFLEKKSKKKTEFYPKWWIFNGDFMWHNPLNKKSPKLQQIPVQNKREQIAKPVVPGNKSQQTAP